MKRLHVLCFLAAIATIALMATVGCGGGGGGGRSQLISRAFVSTTENISVEVGSRFHKSMTVWWVDPATGAHQVQAHLTEATLVSGDATITLNPDGTADYANQRADGSDKIRVGALRLPDDVQQGMAYGIVSVGISPESIRVPITPFPMPEDGSRTIALVAENAERSAPTIKWIHPGDAATRAAVNINAEWRLTEGQGTLVKNPDLSVSFKPALGYVGHVTIVAKVVLPNGTFSETSISGDVLAHPTVTIATPAEGSSVPSPVNVAFNYTNAISAGYKVDGATQVTDVTGKNSFQLTLADGPHTVTMSASNLVETTAIVRSFTVAAAPTVIINSPAEGASVSGNATVSFTATPADASVAYTLNGGAAVNVPAGQTSFVFDSTTLPDGALTLVVTATKGTQSTNATRHLIIANTFDGKLVSDGSPVLLNPDGYAAANIWVARSPDGRWYTYESGKLSILPTDRSSVQHVTIANLSSTVVPVMLGDKGLIALPNQNQGSLEFYDFSGVRVGSPVSGLGSFPCHADYGPDGQVLVSGIGGLNRVDPSTRSFALLSSRSFAAAASDGHKIFGALRGSSNHLVVCDLNGNITRDLTQELGADQGTVLCLRVRPSANLVVAVMRDGPRGAGVLMLDLNGTVVGFVPISVTCLDRDWSGSNKELGARFDPMAILLKEVAR